MMASDAPTDRAQNGNKNKIRRETVVDTTQAGSPRSRPRVTNAPVPARIEVLSRERTISRSSAGWEAKTAVCQGGLRGYGFRLSRQTSRRGFNPH